MPQVTIEKQVPNQYAGRCKSCGIRVEERAGYVCLVRTEGIYKPDWVTYCKSTACLPGQVVKALTRRELTKEGHVIGYEGSEWVAWVKRMPGARFVSAQWGGPHWQVSLAPQHRAEVLEIARKLKLDIAPELLTIDPQAGMSQDERGLAELINTRLAYAKDKGAYPYQLVGIRFMLENKRCLLGDDMGLGKGQPLHSKVLTPSGWVTMGDIKVGAQVMNPEGGVASVVGVYPQGERPVYRFTFTDGTTCEADTNHLWLANSSSRRKRGRPWQVVSTQTILDGPLRDASGGLKWVFPLVTALDMPAADLPLHPYALGAILGDGCTRNHSLTINTPDTAINVRVAACVSPLGCTTTVMRWKGANVGIRITQSKYLNMVLKDLGLYGLHSYDKFIPEVYKHGSTQQRLDLLHGLMDTDGARNGLNGSAPVEFSSSSLRLADDVAALVQSLGGTARRGQRNPTYTYKGDKLQGRTAYRVYVKLPAHLNPFWLARKAITIVPPTKYPVTKRLCAIDYVGEAPTQCIMLDSDNHLYVTDNYIVTHNTIQSLSSIPSDMGALVVVPASVKFNWAKEVRMWRPDLTPRVVEGRQPAESLWPKVGEVVIINYDILPDAPPEFKDGMASMMIIADEAHAFKNSRTKRHQVMKVWGKTAARFVIMTGTPMTNRPPDLWGTLEVAGLARTVFGSLANFRRLFGAVKAGFRWEWGMPDPAVPRLLRTVMLRRTQEEVLPDLPPYSRTVHGVSKALDPEFLEELDELYGNVKAELDAKQLPDFTRMAKVRSMLAAAKVEDMLGVIEEYEANETPLIVFSAHKHPVKTAAARPGWALLTGETKQEERQAIVDRFQRGELKGLALTLAAGSVGITLTRASHMLFVDLDWTPSVNHQAECRIRRIGQDASHLTYIRMVVQHPLDERVEELLEWKTELFRQSIDNVTDEGIVSIPPARISLESSRYANETYEPTIVKVIHETEAQKQERAARTAAEAARDAARRFVAQRLETQKAAQEEKREDNRRRHAEASLHDWLTGLRKTTPPFVQYCLDNRIKLRRALDFMLGNCDGARERDDVGFNAPDAAVAKRMAYLDIEGNQDAAEAVACLLFKYRGQLTRGGFGNMFNYTEDRA